MRVIATFRAQLFDRGSILRALAHTIDEVVRAARAMWEKAVICAAIMHNGASRIVQRQSPRRCAALCARRRPEWRFAHRVARSKAPRETVPIGHETREATPSDGRSGGKNERGRIGRGWSLE